VLTAQGALNYTQVRNSEVREFSEIPFATLQLAGTIGLIVCGYNQITNI
jgi:hypothetical protein